MNSPEGWTCQLVTRLATASFFASSETASFTVALHDPPRLDQDNDRP